MQSYDQKPAHHSGNYHGNNNSNSSNRRTKANKSNSDDGNYILDIERLDGGSDSRTTIMVRNIPNKYNQQMLLDEVNVNHKGTYDFFYLPIDFKNRCNVGYAFINFTDPSCISCFVKEFHGQRWKNFNSGKVCAVTYARIQGQSAMVNRFQNSSLLDKEEEYKPLMFYSSGPSKGMREPFTIGPNRLDRSGQGGPGSTNMYNNNNNNNNNNIGNNGNNDNNNMHGLGRNQNNREELREKLGSVLPAKSFESAGNTDGSSSGGSAGNSGYCSNGDNLAEFNELETQELEGTDKDTVNISEGTISSI